MCGRFTLTIHQLDTLIESLGAHIDPVLLANYRPRYNIAPGQAHLLLRRFQGRRELVLASWGLVSSWAKDRSAAHRQINARAETVAQRPAYRAAFARRRCLLPADGFYEWTGPPSARQPHWFYRPDRSVMLLAGLYEKWLDPATGEGVRTFTIITTAANDAVRPIHHRMPAIVSAGDVGGWLSGPEPAALLDAVDLPLASHPVERRVGSVRHDDPRCIAPCGSGEAAAAGTQLSLLPDEP